MDGLADLLPTMGLCYIPTADAAIVRTDEGELRIVPGPDIPLGAVIQVTRRRLAEVMLTARLTVTDLTDPRAVGLVTMLLLREGRC